MTVRDLAKEYENEYQFLNDRIETLKPLLYVYKGRDLMELRAKLKYYYNLSCECKKCATLLNEYGDLDREVEEEREEDDDENTD